MKRIAAVLLFGLVLVAPAADAQLGPWGPPPYGVPAWVDSNKNGVVDPGETTLYPEGVFNPGAPLPEDQLYIRLRGNPWDPGNTFNTRINATPLLNPTSGMRRNLSDANDRRQAVTIGGTWPAYSFHLVETYNPPPPPPPVTGGRTAAAGRSALATQSAIGDGTLLDTNGDGVIDTLQVGGSHGAVNVPVTNISLVFKDANGDGKADYVSVDWLLSGLLGVKAGDPQVWLPLTADAGGHPNTVTVNFPNPQNPGTFGGTNTVVPIVPPAQGGPAPLGAPALSELGLLSLSAALAGAGVLLARGRVVA